MFFFLVHNQSRHWWPWLADKMSDIEEEFTPASQRAINRGHSVKLGPFWTSKLVGWRRPPASSSHQRYCHICSWSWALWKTCNHQPLQGAEGAAPAIIRWIIPVLCAGDRDRRRARCLHASFCRGCQGSCDSTNLLGFLEPEGFGRQSGQAAHPPLCHCDVITIDSDIQGLCLKKNDWYVAVACGQPSKKASR